MSNQELSDAEESKKLLESKLLPRPISRFQDQCKITVPEDQNPEEKKEEREVTSPFLASKEHEIQQKDEKKPEEEEEENDGYRTPTSEEHKIPVLQECPPAPKRRRIKSRVERKYRYCKNAHLLSSSHTLYSPMSNQELSGAEESKKLLESKLLPRPISRFQDQCKITVPEDQNPEEKKEEREVTSLSLASKEHEIQQKDEKKSEEEEEEDNDGYRTPTSEKHKIPVLQECPPAPKRRRIESWVERKSSSAHFHEMKVFHTEFWLYI